MHEVGDCIVCVSVPSSSGQVVQLNHAAKMLATEDNVSVPSSSGQVVQLDKLTGYRRAKKGFSPLFIGSSGATISISHQACTAALVSVPSSSGQVVQLAAGFGIGFGIVGFSPLFIGSSGATTGPKIASMILCTCFSPLFIGSSGATEVRPILETGIVTPFAA